MLGDTAAAFNDMNKALELTPDAMSYKLRGTLKGRYKDYEGAMADLDTAIEMKPDFASAYIAKAGFENEMKKYKEALADFNKAIEIDPTIFYAYNGRAETKFYLGDYEGTIDDAFTQIRIMPGSGDYHLFEMVAQAFEKKGDPTNAKIYYDKAATFKKE